MVGVLYEIVVLFIKTTIRLSIFIFNLLSGGFYDMHAH